MRSSGIAASKRLGIDDDWIAQDLDNVVAYRLLQFDNEIHLERMKAQARLIANEVARSFNGSGGNEDSYSSGQYADENTQVW